VRPHSILLAALVLILLAGARAIACEDVPPPPIERQTPKNSHQRWGYVVMSDDTRTDGLIWTTRGKPVRIFDRKKGAYRDVKWQKIESLAQVPAEQWLEREWRWLEGGNDQKVYTDRYYRVAKYGTEITLKTGERIVGECVAPIYVQAGKTRRLLELHKRFKSAAPATKKELKPLLYIRKLMLTDRPPKAGAAEGRGGKEQK